MKINKPSRAGSMESNDIYINLHPSENGIEIELESKVMNQFGKRIRHVINETLIEQGLTHVKVVARDSGALDYTIKSRIITAIDRSLEGGSHE